MCGIAGVLNYESFAPVGEEEISRMLGMIRHRGPDEFGILLDGGIGIGSARLSIIDLKTGQQPICNEDGTLWVVFNGEIFNYLELKPELEALGHKFRTTSDTEVLLHAYEQWGPGCLQRFNGQFAFAIWNAKEKSLFLARDRLGVRPLFYTLQKGSLVFGSEIKQILATGRIQAQLDLITLRQVFIFWSPISPGTIFQQIRELPPGQHMTVSNGAVQMERNWEPNFPKDCESDRNPDHRSAEECEEVLEALLIDAAKIRMRADVPVGAYLSGGLDSSIIAYIIRHFGGNRLDTFSIAFDDADFDESRYQKLMADYLGTRHQVVHATHADIGKAFPEIIWHTEVPILRTAPAPMFMLSKLVRDCGYKVVLTGEGADEFLAGYDIFKEAKVRRFWAARQDSRLRPLLLKRLYPDIAGLSKSSAGLLAAFFKDGLAQVDSPGYSHSIRWRNGLRNCRFLSGEQMQTSDITKLVNESIIPAEFGEWSPLARAQFLEIKIFLSQYLLSSQGDRMGMAHSVEGRFPFLDARVVEFCNGLPPQFKMPGLKEKYLLKRLGRKWLPREIGARTKKPYRAPVHQSFFHHQPFDYVRELLSSEQIAATGYFRPEAVSRLIQKIKAGGPVGESDDMALAGILSTQLVHEQFVRRMTMPPAISKERLRIFKNAGALNPDNRPGKLARVSKFSSDHSART